MRWAGAPVGVLLLLILLPPLAPSVSAQSLLDTFESAQLSLDTLEIDPSLRSAEPPPGRVEEAPAPKPPSPEVLPTPPPPQDGVEKLAPVFGVTVREIRVTGSTVFSPDELGQVARPFVDRKLTTEDLEELRQALTTLYTDQGYVNSGAFIPDQDVTDGILEVQLVEGILSDIQVEQVEDAKWFRPYYFTSRIAQSAGVPLNIFSLRERLQLFLQDDRLTRLNSELAAGLRPGEAVLKVQVEEALPYQFFFEFNNFQSPNIGQYRGSLTAVHRNLFGLGDVFRFTFGQSEGLKTLADGGYLLPITPWGTTLEVGFSRSDFRVVEKPVDELDLRSATNVYTATLSQPLYRTPQREFTVFVTGEYETNITTLGGARFSLVPGSSNGVANVAVLRIGQSFLDRGLTQIIALRSQFSVGFDVLQATTNASNQNTSLPSSQFFKWLGQAQWARRFDVDLLGIDLSGLQVLSRMDYQIANRALFPVEQVSLGGRFSVRGYREGTLVRDSAYIFSTETRIPIFPTLLGGEFVHLAPFVDVGAGWQAKKEGREGLFSAAKTLASVGMGVRTAYKGAQFNIYWGQQLNHVLQEEDSLQDWGIHVQFVLQLL